MPKSSLFSPIDRINALASEMQHFVPAERRGSQGFRGELAGLLVISIAASYEECVKITLVEHASRRHIDFEEYAERNFSRLSSRVRVNDLHKYANLFSPAVANNFKSLLKTKKEKISKRTGINIEKRYDQILNWRHDYAHAGIKNTTIGEALKFHIFGVRVLYCFNAAFDC